MIDNVHVDELVALEALEGTENGSAGAETDADDREILQFGPERGLCSSSALLFCWSFLSFFLFSARLLVHSDGGGSAECSSAETLALSELRARRVDGGGEAGRILQTGVESAAGGLESAQAPENRKRDTHKRKDSVRDQQQQQRGAGELGSLVR